MIAMVSDEAHLDKTELHALADQLLLGDPDALERCIAFFIAESRGHWHNRARAMIARRLKHCTLTEAQRTAVCAAVLRRLCNGDFSEQFKDQLRLVAHIDSQALLQSAGECQTSPKAYVRRYAAWVLTRCR